MNQRTALILAGGLTAFMLVVVGAVAATVILKPGTVANAAPVQTPAAAQPAAAISVQLSPAQAAQVASNAAPDATLTNTPDLVSFQGTVAYEVILDQGTLYVDANTGQVLYNGVAAAASAPAGSTRGSEQLFGGHDD